ncbi:MAG: hypothetical protein IPP33_08955 [Flavobacteriales bacterium]|nr:hypothetical protein [Flavobacteriales bacterium]
MAQSPWQRTYGGFGSDEGMSVDNTSDGGFIVLGSTGSWGAGGGDIYLLKLDSTGELQWSKTFGGIGVEQGASVKTLEDGGFAIAGTTASPPATGYDGLLIRTDASGNVLWERTYGGEGGSLSTDCVCCLMGSPWLASLSTVGTMQEMSGSFARTWVV